MKNAPRKRSDCLQLCLYVAGDSPNSIVARSNLQSAIAHLPDEDVSLEIVDVLRDPERGLHDGVLLTPMVVKVAPAPERRIVGNLKDRLLLSMTLGISTEPSDE
jgi:circadian clock protein KaiB